MPTRGILERELRELQDEMLLLGSMVEKAIDRAVHTLRVLDLDEAQRLIADDLLINQKRFQIEEAAIQTIATQQPMAGDLRAIVAILNIIVDLERMGDHAEGIGKITLLHSSQPLLKPLIDVPRMAELARGMLHQALNAFVLRDADLARRICDQDDEVDRLHDRVYEELLGYMIRDPATITRATYLMWVAHNLERIADRATNICERVVFLVTGRMQELNVSKY